MSLVNIVEHLGSESDEKLDDVLMRPNSERLTLIFTTRGQLDKNPILRKRLFQRYDLPECIWSNVCRRLQGYFGSEDTFSNDGSAIINHVTWFHFEVKFPFKDEHGKNTYVWYKMGIATSWTEPNQHTIIFFDAAQSVRNQMILKCENIKEMPALKSPYWAHEFLLDPIIACYDEAVWNLRDQVRELEENRRKKAKAAIGVNPDSLPETKPEFNDLHEILRHALHATEIIGVAIQTLGNICCRQKNFDSEKTFVERTMNAAEEPVTVVERYGRKIKGDLEFQLSQLKSLEARAKANEARIRSEITLAFSTVAQRDSQIQAQIGEAARADSSAMKAIAIVTMIFLPSTSVSAVLSTSFFDFKPPSGESVSGNFWIYWAVSIPLTILVVAIWYLWEWWHPGTRVIFARKRMSTVANHPGEYC